MILGMKGGRIDSKGTRGRLMSNRGRGKRACDGEKNATKEFAEDVLEL